MAPTFQLDPIVSGLTRPRVPSAPSVIQTHPIGLCEGFECFRWAEIRRAFADFPDAMETQRRADELMRDLAIRENHRYIDSHGGLGLIDDGFDRGVRIANDDVEENRRRAEVRHAYRRLEAVVDAPIVAGTVGEATDGDIAAMRSAADLAQNIEAGLGAHLVARQAAAVRPQPPPPEPPARTTTVEPTVLGTARTAADEALTGGRVDGVASAYRPA